MHFYQNVKLFLLRSESLKAVTSALVDFSPVTREEMQMKRVQEGC